MVRFRKTPNDIDFSGDDIHRFLPWLVGVMACLTALLLCLTLSINGWVAGRHNDYSSSFTVNIPASQKTPDTIERIQQTLREAPGVSEVKAVSEAELQAELKDWLGSADASQLPLPAVFDVTLNDEAAGYDYQALQAKLNDIAAGTQVDAHEEWVAAFAQFSGVVQFFMISLAAIILAIMAAAVIFTSRTALKLHARSVSLLHSIGADDRYITRQFQQDAFRLVLPGLLIGTFIATLLYWAGGQYIASMPASVFPPLTMSAGHVALLLALPAACSGGAWIVARMAVMRQLTRVM